MTLEQGVPGSTEGVKNITPDLTASELKSLEYIQNQLVAHASPEPYPPMGFSEVNAIFKEIAMAVAYGEASPEEAANRVMVGIKEATEK